MNLMWTPEISELVLDFPVLQLRGNGIYVSMS